MQNSIKAKIVPMGDSRGVPIPKAFLDQLNATDEVELTLRGDEVVIRKGGHPRDGWEDEFRAMAERGDDKLLDPPVPTEFDLNEWEW